MAARVLCVEFFISLPLLYAFALLLTAPCVLVESFLTVLGESVCHKTHFNKYRVNRTHIHKHMMVTNTLSRLYLLNSLSASGRVGRSSVSIFFSLFEKDTFLNVTAKKN